jgi:hypothetical protein
MYFNFRFFNSFVNIPIFFLRNFGLIDASLAKICFSGTKLFPERKFVTLEKVYHIERVSRKEVHFIDFWYPF